MHSRYAISVGKASTPSVEPFQESTSNTPNAVLTDTLSPSTTIPTTSSPTENTLPLPPNTQIPPSTTSSTSSYTSSSYTSSSYTSTTSPSSSSSKFVSNAANFAISSSNMVVQKMQGIRKSVDFTNTNTNSGISPVVTVSATAIRPTPNRVVSEMNRSTPVVQGHTVTRTRPSSERKGGGETVDEIPANVTLANWQQVYGSEDEENIDMMMHNEGGNPNNRYSDVDGMADVVTSAGVAGVGVEEVIIRQVVPGRIIHVFKDHGE